MGTFDNIVLDTTITVNGWRPSRSGVGFVGEAGGGSESRSSPAPWPRKKYQIPYKVLTQAQRIYLYNFFEARNNIVRSFLLWDRDYFYVSGQVIGTGDGSNKNFQLGVTGGDTANSFFKPILHPVPTGTTIPPELRGSVGGATTASIKVYDNGVLKTEGVDFTANALTGNIAFGTAPAAGHQITATFCYYTTVRFASTELDMNLNGIYGNTDPTFIEVLFE